MELIARLVKIITALGTLDTAAATGAVSDAKAAMAYLKQLVTELIVVDGIVDNITLDTQIRKVASGTSGVIGTGVTKYIEIDSGINSAEILAIIINGVVSFDWTLDTYVPTADAVNTPAAADKRDTIPYLATDNEGGLLRPFAIAYNAFLEFTNDNVGDQTITDVVVVYRSRAAITIGAWT